MVTDDLTLYDKNHIMSRIEKFLFAICSLDSSDLPIPLSRIEELYNCLVTGDTPPTFEPLSRAEKFLMACLGAYDINKLPEPLSRSEILLKKIATGDSNLEDVDNLQSKYEFLLAYIIQNGGIDGEISYMKRTLTKKETTLYNTIEKPVKSAILKGNIVNCFFSIKGVSASGGTYGFIRNEIMANTVYTIFYDYTITGSDMNMVIGSFRKVGTGAIGLPITGTNIVDGPIGEGNYRGRAVFTLTENAMGVMPGWIRSGSGAFVINEMYCVEGDYSSVDIPFISNGLHSVKMPVLKTTGKNLWNNYQIERGSINHLNGENLNQYTTQTRSKDYIPIVPNTKYIATSYSFDGTTSSDLIRYYDSEKKFIGISPNEKSTFLRTVFQMDIDNISHIQLEPGTVATSFEPFKSNILTVNEEVELRGIGEVEVKDELNLVTGELTQRVGEVVFDGSEMWVQNTAWNASMGVYDSSMFNLPFDGAVPIDNQNKINVVCDRLNVDYEQWNTASMSISIFKSPTRVSMVLPKSIAQNISEFKQYLQQSPITIQYQLVTPIVKTVDLSIVNQDGSNTKLSTFNDITYVTLSSEGLIPEAELKVITKNEEVLNTLSLEMDDISTAQTTLKETSNTQSENVDATMIATTEIYEELL